MKKLAALLRTCEVAAVLVSSTQELKRWQNAILRFAKIGVSRTNTIIFTVVSVHTFAKIGVGYPNCVIYIRISS